MNVKFLVAGVIIVVAMLALFAMSINEKSLAYYVSVSDYKKGGAVHGDNFRINGKVLPASIQRVPGGLDLSFQMTDGTETLPVRYRGVVPDTFVDNANVVVEGEMARDGVFEAHTLTAKCPSKYEAADTKTASKGT